MVTGFPGHNRRVSRETQTPGPVEAPPKCIACGKPANAPKGVHGMLAEELVKKYVAQGHKIKAHYDRDEEWYWVGFKTHGGAAETRLASGMCKEVAKFVADKLNEAA